MDSNLIFFPKPHRIACVFLMLWFRIDARTPFGVSVFHLSFWMMLVWSMFKSLHVACEAHFVFRPDSQPHFLACVSSCHGWGISEAGSVLWEGPCLYVSSSLRCSHGWGVSEAGSVLWEGPCLYVSSSLRCSVRPRIPGGRSWGNHPLATGSGVSLLIGY